MLPPLPLLLLWLLLRTTLLLSANAGSPKARPFRVQCAAAGPPPPQQRQAGRHCAPLPWRAWLLAAVHCFFVRLSEPPCSSEATERQAARSGGHAGRQAGRQAAGRGGGSATPRPRPPGPHAARSLLYRAPLDLLDLLPLLSLELLTLRGRELRPVLLGVGGGCRRLSRRHLAQVRGSRQLSGHQGAQMVEGPWVWA